MLLLLSRLMQAMPLSLALAVGRFAGLIWYYLLPVRKKTALGNVARAFGPTMPVWRQRQIVRLSLQNLGMFVVEGLRMPSLTSAKSAALVRRDGMERLDALLQRGRGVVAVTCHLGNFDLLGTSQTLRGYPIDAILKDISWPAAQQFWSEMRNRSGLGCIPPRRSRALIMQQLAQNRIVAFVIDQHLPQHRAVPCIFFGQWAATTFAPVRFALKAGAPILPIYIVRDGPAGHHRIVCGEEFMLQSPSDDEAINEHHNTQRLSDLVEGWVRQYPEQWLWVHRRWKVDDVPAGRGLLPAQPLAVEDTCQKSNPRPTKKQAP